MSLRLIFCFALALLLSMPSARADETAACANGERTCLLDMLEQTITAIDHAPWRDKALREYAKTLAFEGRTDEAISLIARIGNPDTRAMTIRGIGMAASDIGLAGEERDALFARLKEEAEKIEHEASYAIALTYIAMSQAFAGDDAGATQTARAMENAALRNKAFAESAEIQAERGDIEAALASIRHVDDPAFRNKAHRIVAKIFAKTGKYAHAARTAAQIDNPTIKADTVQFILDRQKPRDVERGSGETP